MARTGTDRLAEAVAPGGLLIVDEFDREQLDARTTAWLRCQRQALAAAGIGHEHEHAAGDEDHGLDDIFTWDAVRRALAARFDERSIERIEYLYRYETHPALQPLERAMIDLGAINPTGVRYVGRAR